MKKILYLFFSLSLFKTCSSSQLRPEELAMQISINQERFVEKLSQATTDQAIIKELHQFTLGYLLEEDEIFFNHLVKNSDLSQTTKNLIEQYIFLVKDYYPNLPFIENFEHFIDSYISIDRSYFDIDKFLKLPESDSNTIKNYFKNPKLNKKIEVMIFGKDGTEKSLKRLLLQYLNFIFRLYNQATNVLLAEKHLMEKQHSESRYIDLNIKNAVFKGIAQKNEEETFKQLKIKIKKAIENLFNFSMTINDDNLTLRDLLETFFEKVDKNVTIPVFCALIIKTQFKFLETDPFNTLTDQIKVAKKVLQTIFSVYTLDCLPLEGIF